jgi:hypothetical protein
VAEALAADVIAGRLIGRFDGRSEYGPRALGHRSILGDPRSEAVRDRLNDAKLRRRWRPVAPSIRADGAAGWLTRPMPSPFMLMAFAATERCAALAPAAVHVDGTVRAQTVAPAHRAWHQAIAAFEARTGVPMILNSSFNQAGEPIVESPADALATAVRAGLDVVWLDGVRVELVSRPITRPAPRQRARVGLRGPVPPLLRTFLVQQDDLQVVALDAAAGDPISERAFGLNAHERGAPAAVDGWLALGPLGERGERDGLPVFSLQPVCADDVPPDAAPPRLASILAGSEGWQALVDALQAGQIGELDAVTVDVPAAPSPFGPPASDSDGFASAALSLAEGLHLAEQLSGQTSVAPQLGGRFGCWTLRAGSVEVRMREGLRRLAVEVRGTAGALSLDERGQLALARGEAPPRQRGTSRNVEPLFAAMAASLSAPAAGWPMGDGQAAADRADAALTGWLKAGWRNPGARYAAEREATGQAAPPWQVQARPDGADRVPAVTTEAIATGMTGSALFRLAAVAGGVRPAASWENVGPTEEAFLTAMARVLGLHVERVDRYEHALTERSERPGGGGDRSTLAVATDAASLATIRALTLALTARPSHADEERLARDLGAAYGVPPCCVRAFIRKQRFTLGGSYSHALADLTIGPPAPLVNSKAPTRLIEHFPCSLGCAVSEARAEATLAAALALLPTLADAAAQAAAAQPTTGPVASLTETLRSLTVLAASEPLQAARRWTEAIRSPLLYIDPTRYAVALGGRATLCDHVDADGRVERVATVQGGTWVAAERLMGALPSERESALQGPLEREVVAPVAAAAQRGPIEVRWTLPDPRHPLAGQIVGSGLRIDIPNVGVRMHAGADAARDEQALERAVGMVADWKSPAGPA